MNHYVSPDEKCRQLEMQLHCLMERQKKMGQDLDKMVADQNDAYARLNSYFFGLDWINWVWRFISFALGYFLGMWIFR